MLHSHIPKMADTSRATVRHTTLETACKLALALGVRAEDLLENDARESIDKWHSPAIPGIREQHERDRRPDGIGPKGCRASSPFGSGDMEFKPFEPFEPFDWSNEEEDEMAWDFALPCHPSPPFLCSLVPIIADASLLGLRRSSRMRKNRTFRSSNLNFSSPPIGVGSEWVALLRPRVNQRK